MFDPNEWLQTISSIEFREIVTSELTEDERGISRYWQDRLAEAARQAAERAERDFWNNVSSQSNTADRSNEPFTREVLEEAIARLPSPTPRPSPPTYFGGIEMVRDDACPPDQMYMISRATRWNYFLTLGESREPTYAEQDKEISQGMTLEEFQAWTNDLIREVQDT